MRFVSRSTTTWSRSQLSGSGEEQEERDGIFRSERSYRSFYCAIPLPKGVSADQCEAKFKDGVLEVSLPAPKQEKRQARKIQIG